MNSRRAKALRREARGSTVGRPWKHYARKTEKDSFGRIKGSSFVLDPACARAVYQKLK